MTIIIVTTTITTTITTAITTTTITTANILAMGFSFVQL